MSVFIQKTFLCLYATLYIFKENSVLGRLTKTRGMLFQEIIQQWLCVDQSYELFTDIMGRGGASNVCLDSWMSSSRRQTVNFLKYSLILVQSKLSILREVYKHEPSLWEWLWVKAYLDWSKTDWCLGPYMQSVCSNMHPWTPGVAILCLWIY